MYKDFFLINILFLGWSCDSK